MRVLFTTAPMYGHFYPMVPLAWALRSAGHEVLVAVPADFTGAVTGSGLPAATVSPAVDVAEMIGYDRQGNKVERPADREGVLARSGRGWARLSARLLPGLLDLAESWRPDLIISEPVEYAGPMVAAHRAIPWVEHTWGGLAVPDIFRSAGLSEAAPERATLGLDAPPAPATVLDGCPPTLQRPGAPAAQRMRYLPYNGAASLPPALLRPAGRRLCVTLGSVVPDRLGASTLAELLTPLLAFDCEIALAAAPEIIDDLRPLPPQVVMAGWLPMNLVLPTCELVVHHGGSGTMLTALVNGLPQLMLPRPTADQIDNADRIAQIGAGLRLTVDEVTPHAVRDCCHALLEDLKFCTVATSVSAEIERQPTLAEIVQTLEAQTLKVPA